MMQAGYDVYLPLHKVARQWTDRVKFVEVPLIPSYIFVCVNESEYYNILNISGVVAYVTFEGKAAKIPAKQIEALRQSLSGGLSIETFTKRFERGQEVQVISGLFKGMCGNVYTEAGKAAFIIDMHTIGYAFKVNLSAADIKQVEQL